MLFEFEFVNKKYAIIKQSKRKTIIVIIILITTTNNKLIQEGDILYVKNNTIEYDRIIPYFPTKGNFSCNSSKVNGNGSIYVHTRKKYVFLTEIAYVN